MNTLHLNSQHDLQFIKIMFIYNDFNRLFSNVEVKSKEFVGLE